MRRRTGFSRVLSPRLCCCHATLTTLEFPPVFRAWQSRVYYWDQELYVRMNRECKRAVFVAQLILQWFSMGKTTAKIAPFPRESAPPSNIWFLGPTQVIIPNGISIDSAVFAGLTNVTTDRHTQTQRQTDHAIPSVCDALRPNNNSSRWKSIK